MKIQYDRLLQPKPKLYQMYFPLREKNMSIERNINER